MSVQVSDSSSEFFIKPLLRGHLHQAAFFIALGSCSMLLAACSSERSLFAASVYSFCILNLFGTSALYHRPTWSPRKHALMRRLDHAAIFFMIAGTATPICLLGLSEASGKKLFVMVWAAAFVGVFQALFWSRASKWLTTVLAIFTGWLVAPFIQEIQANIGLTNALLLLFGGIFYTAGAIIYALKRPDPSPKYFGYHEIFHLLVVIAAVLQFIVIARIAT